MGYEIDFLAVGEGSKGGDAIVLRYGNLLGRRSEQTVVVIDGGYKDNGQQIVDLVTGAYGTDRVDVVVSTHPDQDHISGLSVVLEQLTVDELWMHLPWNHASDIASARSTSFATLSLSDKATCSLQQASSLEALASQKGIPIVEPFAGHATADGAFRVVGPSLAYYVELLPQMTDSTSSLVTALSSILHKAADAVRSLIEETLHIETLSDSGETRPSNNSSTVCVLEVEGERCIFTADAGIPALERAVTVLEGEGFVPGAVTMIQVPHHGSRRNVGPSVLDRLLGPKGRDDTDGLAVISAPPKNPEEKHPSKKVANAFRRRGFDVHATQGTNKWFHRGSPARGGYSDSTPLPFYDKVEDDED